MMTEESSPVLEEMEEQKRDWKDEQKEHWFNTRLAFKGLMLGRVQRQQHAEEELASHARQRAGLGNAQPKRETEEMGVSIGNKIFHHYVEAPMPSESVVPGLLQKAVVGAALLAGGSGLGYLASQYTNPNPVVLPSEMIDTDTDTISVIDFPD